MNIYETFPDFDDFDKSGQEELLNLFKNGSMITNSDLEKGIFGKGVDPFPGIRNQKTFQEISNEIAMSTPFGKDSVFYREQREILTGQIPKL